MVKITSVIKAHRYFVLLVIVALFGILAGAAVGLSRRAHPRATGPQTAPTVISKTPAIRVIATDTSSLGNIPQLVVRLQNVSDKDIKALTVSIGKALVVRSFFLSDESIAAGSIVDQRIAMSSNNAQDANISSPNGREIAITAVLFADGTGDGDPRFVQLLANQHAGMRDQAQRVLPKLLRLSNGDDHEQALTDLESDAAALPTKGIGQVSPDYEDGLENARNSLLTRLREIKEQRRTQRRDQAFAQEEKLKRSFNSLAQASSN